MPRLDIIGRSKEFYSIRDPERLVSALEPLLYAPMLSAIFDSLPPFEGVLSAGWQNSRTIDDPTKPVVCRRNGTLKRDYFETTTLVVAQMGSNVKLRARTRGQEVPGNKGLDVVPRHINQFCRPGALMFVIEQYGVHLIAEQSKVKDVTEQHIASVSGAKTCGYVGQEAIEWAEDVVISVAESLAPRVARFSGAVKGLLDPIDIEFSS